MALGRGQEVMPKKKCPETDMDDAPEILGLLPQSSRRVLEGDQEFMQLEHGCEVEVPQPFLDPAFKHNRGRALRSFWSCSPVDCLTV